MGTFFYKHGAPIGQEPLLVFISIIYKPSVKENILARLSVHNEFIKPGSFRQRLNGQHRKCLTLSGKSKIVQTLSGQRIKTGQALSNQIKLAALQ